MIQRRNVSHSILHQPDLFRNGIQYLQEPIGGFGVWNGQFEQPAFDTVSGAGGWENHAAACPEDLTMVMERVTGGLAGNWCFRGGGTNANQRSGYLRQLCYMPVDESRLYNIYCWPGARMGSSRLRWAACAIQRRRCSSPKPTP